jgi:hypothetical protein
MTIESFEDGENSSIQYLSRRPDFAFSYDPARIAVNTQTLNSLCLGDPLDFARDRPAQAIASCLSGRSFDSIAQRLMFLLSIARHKISFEYRNVYPFNMITT